jgi:malonyl-CoA/methylmalonyl-CoA synthetase
VATGEIGAIEIRGPNVFKGYWQMPEKTAEEFRDDGYFISGDLGLIDERGYLHIVGREKDLIITGGLNVYPAEVEAAIDSVPGVAESAVIAVPHADFGEGVTAVVALQPDGGTTESDIRDLLAGELAAFKRPKRIFFVDALPRNSMGKIQKNVLRDRYRDTYQTASQ